jgi:hypothetical protein
MASPPARRTQILTIIAQDPSVKIRRRNPDTNKEEEVILTAQVEIPAEELAPGPRGYRVQVIDYDSSSGVLYPPLEYRILENGLYNDPFIDEGETTLLNDPLFHAQNVYAIVMRTLWRFEYALGRRVSWSFDGHQLQVAPHAFADANAFYSSRDRALLFGYFPKANGKSNGDGKPAGASDMVFNCLSHDIVVHETTHALVDGLRKRYTDPSSPEQAGFHEGFADIVALLSIFSLPPVVAKIIDKNFQDKRATMDEDPTAIDIESLTPERLRDSMLLGLAEQFGTELNPTNDSTALRGRALRRSVEIVPNATLIKDPEYNEPHKRGEILVAAVMNAFIEVWSERLKGLGNKPVAVSEGGRTSRRQRQGSMMDNSPYVYQRLDRQRVVEEGANIADYLLTMAIRALDYTPPTDLEFCDFLSAMLTADYEIRPDDSKYKFRKTILESFHAYGMEPTSKGSTEKGVWEPPDCTLKYDRIHLESMMRDRDEMFRFIWENRTELGLEEDAYTRVLSVRPCVRVNPDDGFTLRETVAEYIQILTLEARELKHLGIKTPQGMPSHQEVTLYGGGTLIFDEFGRAKFLVRNRLLNPLRQTRRLQYLWDYGAFDPSQQGEDSSAMRFAQMHMMRFGVSPLEYERTENDNYLESDEEQEEEPGKEREEKRGEEDKSVQSTQGLQA